MYPDLGRVCTYIWLDVLHTRTYDQNILTLQSEGINDAPRDLLDGTVKCNPACFTEMLCLQLRLWLHIWARASSLPPRSLRALNRCVNILP